MRQSELFFRTQRNTPKDEVSKNAQLLTRANFVYKLMAGVYSFLPLGLRVKDKIIAIVRKEVNALGANEILMPALQPKSIWEPTERWRGLAEIMYQFKDHSGREVSLAPTHEELAATLGQTVIESYADLPASFYQFQTKFRDESRAKSGLIRGREFLMKDLYSFHADEKSLFDFYEEAKKAYKKIFEKCGLKTYITEASGGEFSSIYSHEFMVQSQAGEDEIFLCRLCGFARNKEIAEFKDKSRCPSCQSGVLEKIKTIEVGNIFKLGTKYSEAINFFYKDKNGASQPVIMASYGIGISRLLGTIVEVWNDEKGIIWPKSVAPFLVHLVLIGEPREDLRKFGERVYNKLQRAGVEVLYDDREDISAGEKLVEADLIGLPYRLLVSEKTLVQNKVEVKERGQKQERLFAIEEAIKFLNK